MSLRWITVPAVWMLCGVLGGWAGATEPPPGEAAPAPVPAAAASAPDTAASAPEPPAPPPLSCAAVTAKAMAADVKLAQSPEADLAEQVRLQEASLALWRQAVQRCDGRARERAQQLLADNQRGRERLAEREAAGSQCETSWRDARAMQELAKTALSNRRWSEAGALYRKAETLWDLAAEHCTGDQLEQATQARQDAEIDAHNAERCAPAFERARELTQKQRALPTTAAPAERERASQVAETAWRDATTACKGPALDVARANAAALERERGTPWVATQAPAPAAPAAPRRRGFETVTAAGDVAATAGAGAAAATPGVGAAAPAAPGLVGRLGEAVGGVLKAMRPGSSPTPATATPATPPATSATAAGPTAGVDTVAPNPGAVPAAPPPPTEGEPSPSAEVNQRVGSLHVQGHFSLDAKQRFSGEGRLVWDHGDRYEGQLRAGQRHGRGRFTWANGQTYDGDWVDDQPQGRGRLHFADGNQYDGDIVAGQPHGQGQMQYRSGDHYDGQWQAGQPMGQGSYRWANGQRFTGTWVGLSPQGQGVLAFANGNVYEGRVRDGQPEGAGRMRYANGGEYEGEFKGGLAHGQGRYRWPGGDRYEGAWVQGKKHGQGTFTFASGERWVGRFEDDERSDDGRFYAQ